MRVGRAAVALHLSIAAALPARAESVAVDGPVDQIVVEAAPLGGLPERSLTEDDIAGYAAASRRCFRGG